MPEFGALPTYYAVLQSIYSERNPFASFNNILFSTQWILRNNFLENFNKTLRSVTGLKIKILIIKFEWYILHDISVLHGDTADAR